LARLLDVLLVITSATIIVTYGTFCVATLPVGAAAP